MSKYDDIMARIYAGVDEPVDADAVRFVLVIPGVAAFFQDYESASIWTSVDRVKEQNPEMTTCAAWVSCVYAEAAILFQQNKDMEQHILIIQQAILMSLIAHTYEPQVFQRADMRVVMVLINPPPGTEGYRYYLDKNDTAQCRPLIESFLARREMPLQ